MLTSHEFDLRWILYACADTRESVSSKNQVSKAVPQSENCSLLCLCQGHIAGKSNFFFLLAESRNYIKMQMKLVEKKN